MACSACSEPNSTAQAFCPFCGSFMVEGASCTEDDSLVASTLDAQTRPCATQRCWRCNAEFPADALTCPACGLLMKKPAGSGDTVPEASLLQRLSVCYAGFWRRVVAYSIDLVIVGVAYAGLGFIIGILLAIGNVDFTTAQPLLHIVNYVLLILMNWLYFALYESSASQATPGKMVLGIRVTDEDGDRLPFFFATLRVCAKLLAGPFFVGFLMAAVTEKKQALHDIIVGSVVVKRA